KSGVENLEVEERRPFDGRAIGPKLERSPKRRDDDVTKFLMRPGVVSDLASEQVVICAPLQILAVEIEDLLGSGGWEVLRKHRAKALPCLTIHTPRRKLLDLD